MTTSRPSILCFSGHDPSGGAGIQADIETIASHQCHACSVITALTKQDTRNVQELVPQNPEGIVSQARAVLDDIPVKAFKIGLIGHVDTALAIDEILSDHPDIPVVFDPVLAAGGGAQMSTAELIEVITERLLPRTMILTPNSQEARKLAMGQPDLDQCAIALMEKGCDFVLITGTHENTPHVTNRLYHDKQCIESYSWDRLAFSYHGSGCTLASSIAALTAHGLNPVAAALEAQEYTWNALKEAYKPGKGQHIPNRLYWMEESG